MEPVSLTLLFVSQISFILKKKSKRSAGKKVTKGDTVGRRYSKKSDATHSKTFIYIFFSVAQFLLLCILRNSEYITVSNNKNNPQGYLHL